MDFAIALPNLAQSSLVLSRGPERRQWAYTLPMLIPHLQLSPATLRAVVEEFVTRNGTDHSPEAPRVESVLQQLAAGVVELHFDEESRTCNILPSRLT
jgi:uncharacterized protein